MPVQASSTDALACNAGQALALHCMYYLVDWCVRCYEPDCNEFLVVATGGKRRAGTVTAKAVQILKSRVGKPELEKQRSKYIGGTAAPAESHA